MWLPENDLVIDRFFDSAVDLKSVLINRQCPACALAVLVKDVHHGNTRATGDIGLHRLEQDGRFAVIEHSVVDG